MCFCEVGVGCLEGEGFFLFVGVCLGHYGGLVVVVRASFVKEDLGLFAGVRHEYENVGLLVCG